MDFLESFIYSIDVMLDTKRKRHIVGGILLSAAFFCLADWLLPP